MVDVAVVVIVALAGLSGWRQGLVTGGLGAFGWLAGLLIGMRYVPPQLARIEAIQTGSVVLVTIVALLLCAALGAALMHAVARIVVRATAARPLRALDSLAGAVASVLVAGFVVWALASAVRPAVSASTSRALAESRSLTLLDDVMPDRARTVLADVRGALDRNGFPRVFEGLAPELIHPVPAPDTAAATTAAVRHAAGSVMKVTSASSTCNTLGQGSGWVVADDRVVTNAHVVTGSTKVSVQITGRGRGLPATVVAFDPKLDLAVLAVPGLDSPALPRASNLPNGTSAVVAGFPRNGGYTVKAARVRTTTSAIGRDIYHESPVRREIYALRTTVQPGNSGGPLLTTSGRVAGTVFARSMDDDSTGYALTDSATDAILARAASDSQPVRTGACPAR